MTLCLLKNKLAMLKLQYILRPSPCTGNPLLSTFDGVLRNILSHILNLELNDSQWKKASLTVQMGGQGVRSACMRAPSAFLASASAAATLSLQNAILPESLHDTEDPTVSFALASWKTISRTMTNQSVSSDTSSERITHRWHVAPTKTYKQVVTRQLTRPG